MKNKIRFLSLILALALAVGLLPSAYALSRGQKSTLNGGGAYDSNWAYWSQGASEYEKMRKVGCFIVAISKVMAEAGMKSSNDFDPDDLYAWCCDNDQLTNKYAVKSVKSIIEGYSGAKISITDTGYQSKAMSYADVNAKVMKLLGQGYYVILQRPGHFMYVHSKESKAAEKVVISNSQSDIYNSKSGNGFKKGTDFAARLCKPLADRNDKDKIRRIIAIKSTDEKVPEANTNTNKSISVSFSNYQVRTLTDTSAEPYATVESVGAMVTEVGMYIGLSKESLTKLGSDNGAAKYKKNMWYNTTKYGYGLEPGTTYYYRPYAVVDGGTYWGDINSFTTTGKKAGSARPDPAPATPTPSAEPTYTALVTCNADVLNVRKGPSSSYDKVGGLKRGSQCTVYPNRASNGWAWVEGSGVSGYVFADYLTKFTGNTRTGVVTCNADVLNVRKGPGTSYDKVGQIPNGAACTVYLDVKADWYFVTYGNIAGYVSKNKITLK